jgi:hypothetical protein
MVLVVKDMIGDVCSGVVFGMQICYFFYKNITFGLTLFYYEAYASFSGQVLYNDWYSSLFNVLFTSLPVIALGVFEQDVSSRVCLQVCALGFVCTKTCFLLFIGTEVDGCVTLIMVKEHKDCPCCNFVLLHIC